ncbi:MAG: type I-C CRISPR-associated endonuclease Cas1c [Eubacteriales bacterium]|nr:type I-C CRISPR-associated endonuclease Cas1c [Eubacteriales bacterium]
MKRLLNTLFVLSEDAYLKLDGENVVVHKGGDVAGRYPLHTLESILCFSYAGASPGLMGACAERGVQLSFLTPNGRYLASACGEMRGNVLLRKEQYRRSDSPAASCRIARNMVLGKVYNCRWVLERATRDHPQRVNVARLKQASGLLAKALPAIETMEQLDLLRGWEGEAAQRYFDVLGELVLQNERVFRFEGRSRRPPCDPLNALLSFAYSMLARDCASALSSAGLDPYVGFLHRDRPGRASLALDLMEELRPLMGDRFVLTLVNNRVIKPNDFARGEGGAVLLNESGRKTFFAAWQERKREEIEHPYLGEKLAWGLVPSVQALLLARHLRGDLDQYPPFLWK